MPPRAACCRRARWRRRRAARQRDRRRAGRVPAPGAAAGSTVAPPKPAAVRGGRSAQSASRPGVRPVSASPAEGRAGCRRRRRASSRATRSSPSRRRQKIVNKQATFSGLDKITGRIINFDVDIGETVQFGALQVKPRACYTRPATEAANTDAFVEVDEITLAGRGEAHLLGLDVCGKPGPARRRASDLRHLAHRLQRAAADHCDRGARSGRGRATAAAPAAEGGATRSRPCSSAAAAAAQQRSRGRRPAGPAQRPPLWMRVVR